MRAGRSGPRRAEERRPAACRDYDRPSASGRLGRRGGRRRRHGNPLGAEAGRGWRAPRSRPRAAGGDRLRGDRRRPVVRRAAAARGRPRRRPSPRAPARPPRRGRRLCLLPSPRPGRHRARARNPAPEARPRPRRCGWTRTCRARTCSSTGSSSERRPSRPSDFAPGPHRLNVSAEGYEMYGETVELARRTERDRRDASRRCGSTSGSTSCTSTASGSCRGRLVATHRRPALRGRQGRRLLRGAPLVPRAAPGGLPEEEPAREAAGREDLELHGRRARTRCSSSRRPSRPRARGCDERRLRPPCARVTCRA